MSLVYVFGSHSNVHLGPPIMYLKDSIQRSVRKSHFVPFNVFNVAPLENFYDKLHRTDLVYMIPFNL